MSWSLVKIGEISEILSGNAWKSAQFSTDPNGKLPVIRIQNVSDEETDFVYWDGEFNEKYVVENGNILLSLSGNVKICEWGFGKALLNQRVVKLSPSKDVERRYFYWALSKVVSKLQGLAKHAVIANVSISDLKAFEIPFPPLTEQKRIAAILDKADSLRQKRQQAIELSNQLLRSVFLDMFGDPATNPKGWEEVVLKDIADIRSGVTKGKKVDPSTAVTLPYMRVANVQDGFLALDDVQEIVVSPSDAKKHQLVAGDILLTEGGDPDKLGRGHIWNNEVPNCIHQNHIFSVRIKDKNVVRPEFLSAIISSQRGKRYFLRVGKQTTGIATINKTVLSEFVLFMPSIDLQCKFVSVVEQCNKIVKGFDLTDLSLLNSLSQQVFREKL